MEPMQRIVMEIENKIVLLYIVLLTGLSFSGCSTHYSTLNGGSNQQKIYAISEDMAFILAHRAIVAAIPGHPISSINVPIKGYITVTRFALDKYTQQVLIHPAIGLDMNGSKVEGFYFEVSGSGTSASGQVKNVRLFEKLQELLNDTGNAVYVSNLQAVHYKNK